MMKSEHFPNFFLLATFCSGGGGGTLFLFLLLLTSFSANSPAYAHSSGVEGDNGGGDKEGSSLSLAVVDNADLFLLLKRRFDTELTIAKKAFITTPNSTEAYHKKDEEDFAGYNSNSPKRAKRSKPAKSSPHSSSPLIDDEAKKRAHFLKQQRKTNKVARFFLKHRRIRLQMSASKEEVARRLRRLQTALFGPSSTEERLRLVGKLQAASSNQEEKGLLLKLERALRNLRDEEIMAEAGSGGGGGKNQADKEGKADLKAAKQEAETASKELRRWYGVSLKTIAGARSLRRLGAGVAGIGLLGAAGYKLFIEQKTINQLQKGTEVPPPIEIRPLPTRPEDESFSDVKNQSSRQWNLIFISSGVIIFFLLLVNGILYYHCVVPDVGRGGGGDKSQGQVQGPGPRRVGL